MGNWESIVINLIAALPPSLLALYAALSSKSNGGKLDKVEVTVNGQRGAMVAEIAALKGEALALRSQVVDLKSEVVDLKTEIFRLGRLIP